MSKATAFLGLIETVLFVFAAIPASAQITIGPPKILRVFVAAEGTDNNPCTFAAPCRTFQHAHDTVDPGGEIDVLDPAGYGALKITKSISIEGHGYAGVTRTSGTAITVQAGSADSVHLQGLIIDGGGLGLRGIEFDSGASLGIVDCVVRSFAGDGILLVPGGLFASSKVYITNTVASENGISGININPPGTVESSLEAMFDRVTTNNNTYGVYVSEVQPNARVFITVTNSVSSNNSVYGYYSNLLNSLYLDNVTFSMNGTAGIFAGISPNGLGHGEIVLSRSFGVGAGLIDCSGGGVVTSYGDNRLQGIVTNGCLFQATLQ